MKEILVTPAYEQLFELMLGEAVRQSDARRLFDFLKKREQAQALQALQDFLAPLNIAAQCMTTKDAVERFRSAFLGIVQDIDKTAQKLDAKEAG